MSRAQLRAAMEASLAEAAAKAAAALGTRAVRCGGDPIESKGGARGSGSSALWKKTERQESERIEERAKGGRVWRKRKRTKRKMLNKKKFLMMLHVRLNIILALIS